MARIRSIKPETWEDQKLASLPRDARLLFIGLWSVADDDGRLRGFASFVKGKVFPYDSDMTNEVVDGLLNQLASLERIQRYQVDGQDYIWICNFNKHQKIDHPSKSQIPAPPPPGKSSRKIRESSRVAREPSAKPRENFAPDQERSGLEGKGEDGSGAENQPAPDLATSFQATWNECTPAPIPRLDKLTPERVAKIEARAGEYG